MAAAGRLERAEALLTRIVGGIGHLTGWLLFLLMAVIIFDVVTRRFLVIGSPRLQELEWHIHTAVFAAALGHALVTDSHVRIELVRERLSDRVRAWIEIGGTLLLLLPFTVVTIYYGTHFALTSYLQGEGSPSPQGLPHRFVIKAAIPIGMTLLLAGGLAVLLRNVLFLLGRGGRPPAGAGATDPEFPSTDER